MDSEVKALTPAVIPKDGEAALVRAGDFMPLMTVDEAVKRKEMVNEFIGKVLEEDTDYGKMPGGGKDQRKVLLKPGAEKLCSIFGLAPRYQVEKEVEDWTGADHGGEPLFFYKYRCQLYRGDLFMGEAIGSCNSWETKYRYRWVTEDVAKLRPDFHILPKRGGTRNLFEPIFAIERKSTEGQYGKPAEYWRAFDDAIQARTARYIEGRQLGKKKFDGWEITVDTTLYRIPNPDVADCVNTCQKIAQKRAQVSAVLVVTNCSDAFTPDMEDFEEPEAAGPAPAPPLDKPAPAGKSPEKPATDTLPSGRFIPEELQPQFRAIQGGANAKEAWTMMEKKLAAAAGVEGVNEYNRIAADFKKKMDAGEAKRTDILNSLLDMWEAAERLKTEKAQTAYAAVDADVPF